MSLRDILDAHARALETGGAPGILSADVILSAIGRPYSGYHRHIWSKAAALTHSLVTKPWVLEAGVAIRYNNLPGLAYKIDRLLDDPARLAAMRATARRLARPHAAREIAVTLLSTEPAG